MLKYLHFLWQKYIEPYDPFGLQLQQALKSALAVVISIGIILFFNTPQPQWLVFSTAFVMQMSLGTTKKNHILTQMIGGLILSIGVFISSLLGGNIILFVILMTFATFITFYLAKYGPNIYSPAIFILVMILMAGSFPLDFITSCYRFGNCLIGTILSLLISNLIWPFRPCKLLKQNLAKGFTNISGYIKYTIDDSLRGNFHRLQRYEKKAKVLKFIENCRCLARNHPKKVDTTILHYQEQLFIQVIALSDLLNKPNSEYTLDNILPELSALTPTLVKTINHTTKINLDQLQTKINNVTTLLKNKDFRMFINYDINNITYILNNIYQTLTCIYEN